MTSREKNQERMLEILTKSHCYDCGEQDFRVLTWDHRDRSKKKGTISELIHRGLSWDIIQAELAKTDCVCYNDHVRREGLRDNSKRQQLYAKLHRMENIKEARKRSEKGSLDKERG